MVNKLNDIDFNSSKDQHLFGDLYEQLLKDLQSAGNAGEFYTPRAVTQFMVGHDQPPNWARRSWTPPAAPGAS